MARKYRKHSRRHSSRALTFRNPGAILSTITSAPRQMVKLDFVKEAASVAVGFVLPNIAMNYLPVQFRDAQWKSYASKVVTVSVLSALGGMVNKRVGRAIMLGGSISVLLDLYADFLAPRLGGAPGASAAPRTSAYYGDLSAYYGENMGDGDYSDGVGNLAEAFAS